MQLHYKSSSRVFSYVTSHPVKNSTTFTLQVTIRGRKGRGISHENYPFWSGVANREKSIYYNRMLKYPNRAVKVLNKKVFLKVNKKNICLQLESNH